MSDLNNWPEPIVRVQCLSESGIRTTPERYVRPLRDRPSYGAVDANIPIINFESLDSPDESVRNQTLESISHACRHWGLFQVVNHGVDHELITRMQKAWRDFFHLPLGEKQKYANTPATYEGIDCKILSRVSQSMRKTNQDLLDQPWTAREQAFHEALGGDEDRGVTLWANFYPKCPQPELALGLSHHSDPSGLTILLPDADVSGLQVLHDDEWITVAAVPNAFVVNLGDQMQVLTNEAYKSVEHRVIVNPMKERLSLSLFYNPGWEVVMKPLDELLTDESPARYEPMTFNKSLCFIRTKGLRDKFQVKSLKST